MARNNTKRPPKKVTSIIVDGHSEAWYFQLMKQNEKLSIDIKPDIPQRKSLVDQYHAVIENALHYDSVIWVVDFDVIQKEERERKKGQLSPLEAFRNYKEKLTRYNNVVVLVNNACFELWLLLHFEYTSKNFKDCQEVEKALKQYLPKYTKTEKFYKQVNNDLYKQLMKKQPDAIENAKKLGEFDINNPYDAKAEIYQMIEALLKNAPTT